MWLHKVQLYSLQLLMSNFHQTNKVLLFFHLMVPRLKMLRVYLVYTVQVVFEVIPINNASLPSITFVHTGITSLAHNSNFCF